jgi:hypothetical protein
MSEMEGMPDCAICAHPAGSHDDEFGNCEHLPNPYGLNQRDGCDCPGYCEQVPIDDFTAAVVAVKILRHLGLANDGVYHARPSQLRELTYCVKSMSADGCPFEDSDVAAIVDGEEREVGSTYGQLLGFWALSRVLNDVFDNPDSSGPGNEDGLNVAQLSM